MNVTVHRPRQHHRYIITYYLRSFHFSMCLLCIEKEKGNKGKGNLLLSHSAPMLLCPFHQSPAQSVIHCFYDIPSLFIVLLLPCSTLPCQQSKQKRILPEQYPFENLFSKVCGTHEACVPDVLNLITMNRCLPDESSLMKHRGKPLHGG